MNLRVASLLYSRSVFKFSVLRDFVLLFTVAVSMLPALMRRRFDILDDY